MKLRNKKTGETGYLISKNWNETVLIIMDRNGVQLGKYNSLAGLNAEWEDYEEQKEYWYIDYDGCILCDEKDNSSAEKMMISMGNHFESLEEAEKAVEKLKAWKRLKDKGFRFIEGWLDNNDDFIIKAKLGHVGLIDQPDVHLLFGGEE